MIKAKFYRKNNKIFGFKIVGHAGYADEGEDIVCSAVTILVINTINALEAFTQAHLICEADEVNGSDISLTLPELKSGKEDHDVTLLLDTMYLGLSDVEKNYGKYITITDEEVL